MNVLTHTSSVYINVFNSYLSQFTSWGEWLFLSLLTISIAWMCFWHAFDKHSLVETMPAFLKKITVILIFYSLILHPEWLTELLKTAGFMGKTLTHFDIDPSSIIDTGMGLGNKMIAPLGKTSILRLGFGVLVVGVAYLGVIYVFINIAIELTVTLITASALIAISPLFLSFIAIDATAAIARNALDTIISHAVKLLGLYLIAAIGTNTIAAVANTVPDTIDKFDPYCWIVAVVFLFHALAKTLPNQFAKIVSSAFQEPKAVDVTALMLAAAHSASTVTPAVKSASVAAQSAGKLAGSTGFNVMSHLSSGLKENGNVLQSVGSAAVSVAKDLGKAVGGNISEHFKNVSQKMAGGEGVGQVDGVAKRMYEASKDATSKAPSSKATSSMAQALSGGFKKS